MQKLLTTALLLAVSSTSFAQNKYHPFRVDKMYGVTDTLGNELVKPVHKFCEQFRSGKEFALYNFNDDVKDLIVNTSTGKILTFAYINPGEATVNNVSYTLVTEKTKKYLRSEEDGKIIPLKEDYSDFKTEGKYIIAKYYASALPAPPPPPVKQVKSKGGLLPPPPMLPPPMKIPPPGFSNYAVIAANDETLKPVMKGLYKTYLPLYNNKAEETIVRVKTVTYGPRQHSNFYAIIFSTDHTHSLYDTAMKLVKKFELKNASKEQLEEIASDIMKTKLSEYDEASAVPPMGVPSKNRPEPAVVYPVFDVEKSPNGNNQFVLKQSATDVKVIFETPSRITWNGKDHSIYISDTDTEFAVDPQSGKIWLPQKYWATAGITVK
ncbi:hypothetical protein HHL17_15935 [Chitinophaga sp. G-6-1-13]|uniref:Uncharacterized protein n=1 Tax=Chitinophaga fulva TaxID=2728842 RepID=A0A848GMU1_9BACT|nr:hypothetical protein [Chitinophaga fulva]NML38699.1 hypothetical protein [Chitinophaga fulva]